MADLETRRARSLRRRSTPAEQLLWRVLRDRGALGLKFRRQVPLGRYVVDFVCLEHRLIVELDGGIHDAAIYDAERVSNRQAWLEAQGFVVLRFRNSEADLPHRIVERVRGHVGASTPHPTPSGPPSPARGEGD